VIKIITSKIEASRRAQAQRCFSKSGSEQNRTTLEDRSLGQAITQFSGRLVSACLLFLFANTSFAVPIDRAPADDCQSLGTLTAPATPARLVIIIDDMGNNFKRGKDALSLPGKLNYAVIPYTPHGKALAGAAVENGKEVMLHAPMSTQDRIPLGKGGLTPELSREEFRAQLNASLEEFPQIVGINNHMGSDLTQRRPQMAWVMQELRSRDLYFVDSRTSQRSVAAKVASEFNVPHLSRNVFLDNVRSREAIQGQFREVVARAQRHGLAVAIGHPYQVTIDYLREALPMLEAQGIELALVSEALLPKVQEVSKAEPKAKDEGELVVLQLASTLSDKTNKKSGASKTVSVALNESFVENCLWEQKLAENEIALDSQEYDGT
jgi:polysaccharide deacetylase 2 family uncharacterized protein YibQ